MSATIFRSLLLGFAIPVGLLSPLLNAQVPSAPVIVASTYIDGGGYQYGWDGAWSCAVDSAGNVYVAGDTQEPGFPTTANVIQKTFGAGGQDGFVAKFDKNGNLLWSTFLGGSSWDGVYHVTTDANGNAVVSGVTASPDFPTTTNAVQKTIASGAYVAFVTVISADGTQILYSTFLGGTVGDSAPPLPVNIGHLIPQDGTYTTGVGVTVGNDGTIYVCGGTNTIDMPVTSNAAQMVIGGEEDGYVARIDPTKSGSAGLLYSTYLGGALSDFCAAIAVDAGGNAFVTGEAQSPDFPTTLGAYQRVHAPGTAAFVTKLSPDGKTLVYSTLVSGSQGSSAGSGTNYTAPSAIAIDADGHAYIDGETNDTDFPTTAGVIQPSAGGQNDGFVTEFAADGTSVVFSTYLGGSDYDGLFALKLDGSGNIFVAGYTASRDLPQVNPFQSSFGGYNDWLIAELSPGGTTLLLASYLGGSDQEYAYGLDLRDNQLYLAGTTVSQDFPVTNCAANSSYNGAAGDAALAIVHLPATATELVGAASRQNHGSAGSFDIDLPLSGKLGIECRNGGGAGDYAVVFKFADPLTSVGCVDVSAAGATIANEAIGTDPHEYVVNLTGVANAQTITVTLNNISDSSGHFSGSASVAMSVLGGDTNGDGFVNSADISQAKSQSGQPVGVANFREDVNADGFINSADIGLVKSKSGTALP